MIFTQSGYTPGDDPASVPLIGYDNQITNITASSEETGFPATNLMNSATHLVWKASSTAAQTIGITTGSTCNYLAIAAHNFADANIGVGINTSTNADAISGYLTILMHFEGTNGGTDYYDTSGNDVAFRNSTTGLLTTAQFKFGTMSVNFAGTGYIYAGGSNFAFGAGAFTIDFWVRINATGAVYTFFDSDAATTGFSIRKNASDFLVFRTAATDRITGGTALTTGTWHHVAVARSGTSTKMFLNGTQQGSTYTDSNTYTAAAQTRFGMNQSSAEAFNGWLDELRVLTGSAAYTANFTAPTAAYVDGLTSLFGDYQTLLHFDGTDASTTITDSSINNHTWTAAGNAQLDTAQKQFGTAALLLDGTGDYIQGDGSADFEFGTGAFTVDFWIRPNAIATSRLYATAPLADTANYFAIYLHSGGTVRMYSTTDRITGTTVLTTGTWYHIALTRSGTSTRLFVNGTQEGSTYTDTNDYLAGTNRPVFGVNGLTGNTEFFNGWIDEARIIRGTALWTSGFAAPIRAAGTTATVGRTVGFDDNLPAIFRFSSTTNDLSLKLSVGTSVAQAAVIYAGQLLVLERSIKVDVPHLDIPHARMSNVLVGMSESGNFLGRVLLAEWRESKAEFAWFTPDWYRSTFEPFVQSAVTDPFFWAWNPDEYPEETAFAWIIEDIRPETDPATRRMAATISMRAIA